MMGSEKLSINMIKDQFDRQVRAGSVVLTAPTGSGKSTAVPRWCAARGRVLVIEPRRVACRGLAGFVARLENASLGEAVGYAVRDEHRFCDRSRIVFATPGVVIRWLTRTEPLPFDVVILDEFHERSLEVDLLLALFQKRSAGRLVVMSATLDARRIAQHLDAALLIGEGRRYDVEVHYIKGQTLLPSTNGLVSRLTAALKQTEKMGKRGDVLVFLPGKGEIATIRDQLTPLASREILTVHGGLTLGEQNRVFEGGKTPRIILSTNVAETSITIPNVEVVIDAGLVRRTRYANGRGFLTLSPVAMDSAAQRTGRAGRVKPGVCFRLWSEEAVLQPATPPEIHRESLSPLLLAAAACNASIDGLLFLDPPKPYAVDAARAELVDLRAIDTAGKITARGQALFGFPLDAPLASLLVEAEKEDCLRDAIDLVSALSVGRPLFSTRRPTDPAADLRLEGCDAVAHIRAMREGAPERHLLNAHVLGEAKATRQRLLKGWALSERGEEHRPISRKALIRAALRSDPRSAFIARKRRGRIFWAGGGMEIRLARESAIDEEKTEAIALLASVALGEGHRKDTVFATAAIPVRFSDLAAAALGEETVVHAAKDGEVLVAEIHRRFAGHVIGVREAVPRGKMARDGLAALLLGKKLFPREIDRARRRLNAAALAQKINRASFLDIEKMDLGEYETGPVPSLEEWISHRIFALGFESGEDLALLSADDFHVPALPKETADRLAVQFPERLSLGNAIYDVGYDVTSGEVTLNRTEGNNKHPPSLSILPAFRGFRIKVKHHSKVWVLRG